MIVRNIPLVIFSRGLTAGLAFLTMLVLMWLLTLDDFAKYSFFFTIFTLCSVIPNIGVNNYIVLENEDELHKKSAIQNRMAVCIALSIIIFTIGKLFHLKDILVYSCLAGLLSSIFDLNLSIVQSTKNMKVYALLMPLKTLSIFLISIVTLVSSKNFLNDYFYNFLIFFSISFFIFTGFYVLKNIKPNLNIHIYKKSYNFIIYEVVALILVRCEVFILSWYLSKGFILNKDLASYWASYNFIMVLSLIGSTMSNMILPYIKNNNDTQGFSEIVRKTSMFMKVFIVLLIIFSFVFSEFFLTKYNGMYICVGIMSLGIYFAFLANIDRLKIMVGIGSNKYANQVVISQLVVSIILNFTLIYFIGLIGAVISYFLTRFFGFVLLRIEICKVKK